VRNVLLAWQISNFSGWGLVGLHTFCHWALSGEIQPVMGNPIGPEELNFVHPMVAGQIAAAAAQSNRIGESIETLMRSRNGRVTLDFPVVHALGNDFNTPATQLRGSRNLGRIVFEDLDTLRAARQRARDYDCLVCISEWNAAALRQACSTPVVLTHEGIDPATFFPGPRSAFADPGRFTIFSGGKIEHRKAQDLVLLAFREFSARHAEAVLVTSWHNPAPKLSSGFKGKLKAPLELGADGRLLIHKWAHDNGVDPRRVIDIGLMPNPLLPTVLRDMDCALFPNRCEGGTNLVCMEAMACGVPAIVASNTGVKDIVADGNCLALQRQSRVGGDAGRNTEGWGESDVDEILDALERLYTSAALRREIGAQGAAYMARRTWQKHSQALKDVVLGRGDVA
jgi:glycosyltransferase involved in cell wall biosynthesis